MPLDHIAKSKRLCLAARLMSADGNNGLFSRHPERAPHQRTPQLEARILYWTAKKPSDGSTHWSVRKLANQLGVPKSTVERVWRRAGLKPHRLERYMMSNDPDFETKAADIIGLYMNPP